MSYITRNPKRVIGGLATALAAAGIAVGSGASFTSQTASAANVFSSGTMSQTNSRDGAAIATKGNMKPGDVQTGQVKIKNTGTVASAFKLSEVSDSSTFTAGNLQLVIKDGATTIYSGDFGALNAPIALGEYAAGEERTYDFTVTFAQSAGNEDEDKTASATYQWDQVSTPAAG